KFLEMVKHGEEVYCTTEVSNVIFLQKETPPLGWVEYRTLEGEVKFQHPACFRIISKGNKSAECYIKGLNYKERTSVVERKARECGFRVEKLELRTSFHLIIYGDQQNQVDDFILIWC
ncbi:MAG: hypothetical protein ACW986_18820, partial [Promethearchaeota archaeon]